MMEHSHEQQAVSTTMMLPQTYELGAHQVTIEQDQHITIEHVTLALQLEREEAYRLLLVLQELFK